MPRLKCIRKKACKLEDMEDTQKFGETYKTNMTSTANRPIGESLKEYGQAI